MLLKGGVATPSTPPLDPPLEIRATNKEATTLLYAMFVYNARHEDW